MVLHPIISHLQRDKEYWSSIHTRNQSFKKSFCVFSFLYFKELASFLYIFSSFFPCTFYFFPMPFPFFSTFFCSLHYFLFPMLFPFFPTLFIFFYTIVYFLHPFFCSLHHRLFPTSFPLFPILSFPPYTLSLVPYILAFLPYTFSFFIPTLSFLSHAFTCCISSLHSFLLPLPSSCLHLYVVSSPFPCFLHISILLSHSTEGDPTSQSTNTESSSHS